MNTEYRIRWKRVGLRPKSKAFASRRAADRFLIQLGPEPWKAWGKNPNALICCSGEECNCGGITVAEEAMDKRAHMPLIQWITVGVRSVSDWVQESREVVNDLPDEVEDDRDDGRELAMVGIKTGLDATNDMDNCW